MNRCVIFTMCIVVMLFTGCGGAGSGTSPAVGSSLQQGPWEFRGTTQTPGYSWVIEAVLNSQGTQFSASQSALFFIVTTNINGTSGSTFGGFCDFIPGGNSLNGSVDGTGGVTVNFSDPLDSYIANGIISNGTAILGTYSGPSSDCPYFGTFTGGRVTQPVSGTFSGTLSLDNGAVDTVTLVVNSQNNPQLTITGTSSGTDNGPVTLTGNLVANGLQVTGSIGTDGVSLYGLYDPTKREIIIAENRSPNLSGSIGTLTSP